MVPELVSVTCLPPQAMYGPIAEPCANTVIAHKRSEEALRQIRTSLVTRPISTHSTTKMLPLASKQAEWGAMNFPGTN